MILFDNYPLAMQQWWSGGVVEWCRHEPEQETTFPQPPECKLYTRQKSAERKLFFLAPPQSAVQNIPDENSTKQEISKD